jgi:RecA-family ATPase
MLDGDPGLGKSCVALDWAARLTRGRAMPFAAAATALPAADAVLLSGEDPRPVVLARCAAAEGDCGRLHIVRPALDDLLGAKPPPDHLERMRLPRDLDRLRELLRRTAARLVIIDPLVAFLDPSVQWHIDQSVRRLLLALAQLAEESGAAFLLLRHLNKQSRLKAIYRGSGSIALIGNARAGLVVVEHPDQPDERLLVTQKSNLCAPAPAARYALRPAGESVRVEWLAEERLDAAQLHRAPAQSEESYAVAEAVEFLKQQLREGYDVPANSLIREARQAGITEKTLRRAKFKLGVISKVWACGRERTWVWQLPPLGPPPPER